MRPRSWRGEVTWGWPDGPVWFGLLPEGFTDWFQFCWRVCNAGLPSAHAGLPKLNLHILPKSTSGGGTSVSRPGPQHEELYHGTHQMVPVGASLGAGRRSTYKYLPVHHWPFAFHSFLLERFSAMVSLSLGGKHGELTGGLNEQGCWFNLVGRSQMT